MVFYELRIYSQPVIVFACSTSIVPHENSKNIIDHRKGIIEFSITEGIDMQIDSEDSTVKINDNTLAMFMPDCKYSLWPCEICQRGILSSIAIRISDMEYIHHNENDIHRIKKLLDNSSGLMLPHVYQTDDEERGMISSLMKSLISRYREKSAAGNCICLSKWYELCAMIDAGFRASICELVKSPDYRPPSNAYYNVYKIKKYILSHLTEKISLQNAAESLGLSCGYVGKIFKNETGLTFSDYVSAQRVRHLCELIDSNVRGSFDELAAECGLHDYRYAQRLFKRFNGVSMREYRQLGKGITLYHKNPWTENEIDRDIWTDDNKS